MPIVQLPQDTGLATLGAGISGGVDRFYREKERQRAEAREQEKIGLAQDQFAESKRHTGVMERQGQQGLDLRSQEFIQAMKLGMENGLNQDMAALISASAALPPERQAKVVPEIIREIVRQSEGDSKGMAEISKALQAGERDYAYVLGLVETLWQGIDENPDLDAGEKAVKFTNEYESYVNEYWSEIPREFMERLRQSDVVKSHKTSTSETQAREATAQQVIDTTDVMTKATIAQSETATIVAELERKVALGIASDAEKAQLEELHARVVKGDVTQQDTALVGILRARISQLESNTAGAFKPGATINIARLDTVDPQVAEGHGLYMVLNQILDVDDEGAEKTADFWNKWILAVPANSAERREREIKVNEWVERNPLVAAIWR